MVAVDARKLEVDAGEGSGCEPSYSSSPRSNDRRQDSGLRGNEYAIGCMRKGKACLEECAQEMSSRQIQQNVRVLKTSRSGASCAREKRVNMASLHACTANVVQPDHS